MPYDLLIKNGTVIDGSGAPRHRADVAVAGGRIAEIGAIRADAAEVVDAGGLTLMPGIIDLHTHYDAQVTWDRTLSPSPPVRRPHEGSTCQSPKANGRWWPGGAMRPC